MPDQNPLGSQTGSNTNTPPANLPVKPAGTIPPAPSLPPVQIPNPSVPPATGSVPSFPPKPSISPTPPAPQTPQKPAFSVPSMPAAPSVLPKPPVMPVIPKPAPTPPPIPPKPVIQPPASIPSVPVAPPLKPSISIPQTPPAQPSTSFKPDSLRSSVRTMADDLANLSKGVSPSGIQTDISLKPPIPSSRPVTLPVLPPRPPVPSGPISVPTLNGHSTRNLTITIVSLVMFTLIGFSVWFFVYHQSSSQVTDRPQPSGTIVSSATPLPGIETVFPVVDSVTIDVDANVFPRFKEIVSSSITETGQTGLYKIYKPQKPNGDKYTFSEFSLKSLIKTPAGVLSQLNDSEFYISLMRETDGTIGYGFIVEAKDSVQLRSELLTWESVLTTDLTNLFIFDPKKAASPAFLDNTYQNTPVRYRNFPGPSSTIDYCVSVAPNGKSFLVFTNSRSHIYSIIDKIQLLKD